MITIVALLSNIIISIIVYCQEATQKPNPTFHYHRQLIDQLLKRVTNFKWQSEGANFLVFLNNFGNPFIICGWLMSGLVAIGNSLLWVRLIWSGQFVIIFRNANVMVTGKRNEIILFKFGGHFRGLLTSHETLPLLENNTGQTDWKGIQRVGINLRRISLS